MKCCCIMALVASHHMCRQMGRVARVNMARKQAKMQAEIRFAVQLLIRFNGIVSCVSVRLFPKFRQYRMQAPWSTRSSRSVIAIAICFKFQVQVLQLQVKSGASRPGASVLGPRPGGTRRRRRLHLQVHGVWGACELELEVAIRVLPVDA